MPLAGKNILIIGGTSGIGSATAAKLAATGATVYQASRTASGPNTAKIDVSQPFNFPNGYLPDVLHGLVYCPGSINLKPFTRITREQFIEEYTLNVVGAFTAVQQALRQLKAANGASIVLFSTVAAKVGLPFHASIAAAKGGLEAMARTLAAELAPSQIRVNVIAPGLTDTPLAASLLDNDAKREASAKRHPLGRVGTPSDMAKAALFLLGEGGDWITGITIGVDGGMGHLR